MSEQTAEGCITEVREERYVAQIEASRVTIWFTDGMGEVVSLFRGNPDCKAMEGRLSINIGLFPEETVFQRMRRAGVIETLIGQHDSSRNTISIGYERVEGGQYRLTQYPECVMCYEEDGVTPSYIEVTRKRSIRGKANGVVVSYQCPFILDADPLMDQVAKDGDVEPILKLLNREVEQVYWNP